MKVFKCAYNQCKFNNEVSEEIAVKHKNRYYHVECLQEATNKNEVRQLFFEHINKTEVASSLNKTINMIIDEKNVASDLLLFAIKYVIRNKLPLNHASGLHYIINNTKMKEEYYKTKANELMKQTKNTTIENIKFQDEITFNSNVENNSWNKLFKG